MEDRQFLELMKSQKAIYLLMKAKLLHMRGNEDLAHRLEIEAQNLCDSAYDWAKMRNEGSAGPV